MSLHEFIAAEEMMRAFQEEYKQPATVKHESAPRKVKLVLAPETNNLHQT